MKKSSKFQKYQFLRVKDLRAKYLEKPISIAGEIIKKTKVKPLLEIFRFECEKCKKIKKLSKEEFNDREVRDKKLLKCSCGAKKRFKAITGKFSDYQILLIKDIRAKSPSWDTQEEEEYDSDLRNDENVVHVRVNGDVIDNIPSDFLDINEKIIINGKLEAKPIFLSDGEPCHSSHDWVIIADKIRHPQCKVIKIESNKSEKIKTFN